MSVIRFGIGSPDKARSNTWSLSTGRGEVYLSRRLENELIKFSLHKSGIWRFAINSSKPRSAFFKWDRPNPVLNSWILGPTIIFSPFVPKKTIKQKENYAKKIKWLSLPPDDYVRIAMVIFSKNETSAENYFRSRLPNADWSESLEIEDNGKGISDRVWVFSWIEPLPEFRKKQILDLHDGIKIHHKGDGKSIKASFYPLLLPTEEERLAGLSPTFIDIIPSRNNLQRDIKQ